MNFHDYDYFLPEKNLALEPAVPRDSSKLFVYNTKNDLISFDSFYNLNKYLPNNSFMVLNNTRVLPARITMKKESRGKVVALLLVNEIIRNNLPMIVDRKIKVGERIFFDDKNFLNVISQNKNIFEARFDFSKQKLFSLLEKYGTMPIPPYLKKSSLTRDELFEKYQTIFAKTDGSAAAPTASLHFTNRIFKDLNKKRIKQLYVTLHVGMGTFAPITDENIKQKKLHEEYYEVDREKLQLIDQLKFRGKKLVAVGTTVVRTLESIVNNDSVRQFLSHENLSLPAKAGGPFSEVKKSFLPRQTIINKTDLFIFPPYKFKMVDILITNFHLPKSSLMMLVESFLQYKKAKRNLIDLYNIAIKNNFRFYSFGDAMLIL
jgi:S-adenosylmethionine:tRNA ribosyltransferase-isomerase